MKRICQRQLGPHSRKTMARACDLPPAQGATEPRAFARMDHTHHAAPDVDLFQLRDTSVPCRHGDLPQGDIERVLGWCVRKVAIVDGE